MPTINQALIIRLSDVLGIEVKTVYSRIQALVSETHLEKHIAALALARQNNININKYSSPEDRDQLRTNFAPISATGQQRPQDEKKLMGPQVSRKPTPFIKRKAKNAERSVFVIRGRDTSLTESVYSFIRSLNLVVIEWNHALQQASKGNANPYINDILDKVMQRAGALVVLLSPEDQVALHPDLVGISEKKTEGKNQLQARPNVLFEAGLALIQRKRY